MPYRSVTRSDDLMLTGLHSPVSMAVATVSASMSGHGPVYVCDLTPENYWNTNQLTFGRVFNSGCPKIRQNLTLNSDMKAFIAV